MREGVKYMVVKITVSYCVLILEVGHDLMTTYQFISHRDSIYSLQLCHISVIASQIAGNSTICLIVYANATEKSNLRIVGAL